MWVRITFSIVGRIDAGGGQVLLQLAGGGQQVVARAGLDQRQTTGREWIA